MCVLSSSFHFVMRYFERQHITEAKTDFQTQQIFLAICRSFVSPTVSLTAPLNEDHRAKLYVNWDNWTIDGLCNGSLDGNDLAWQKSQIEIILQISSKLRRKLCLIDEFLANPRPFARGVDLPLDPDSLVTSVCDALSFFADAKAIVSKVLESETKFSGLCHFDDFLQTLKKSFSEFPHYLEKLISSKNEHLTTKAAPICTFWADFLQHLAFYGTEHPMPAWKTALFEGLVHLVGNYLNLRLNSANDKTVDCLVNQKERLGFLESIWTDDELMFCRVNFIEKCGKTIPLRSLEENGQLRSFHETFTSHLHKFKEDGRLRFTRCFLVQLVNQSLICHSTHLDKILLVYLAKENLLKMQLNSIIDATSLNSYWVTQHPEFFDENGLLEKEINERFVKQFWPLQILLDRQLYRHLFSVCAHLRRIQRPFHQLMNSISNVHNRRRERFCGQLAHRAILKERLGQSLGAQLMGQLQQLLQLLFTYSFSLNSFYARSLTENVNKPRKEDERIHFNVLMELVEEWKSALSNLLLIIGDVFLHPIEELLRISDTFCNSDNEQNIDQESNESEKDRFYDDAELRLLVEWSDRLRRIRLFIKHRQSQYITNVNKILPLIIC